MSAQEVEPEPLKEGDWCLVWGQVDKVESLAGSFVSIGRSGERRYFASNAIVRPDAGQVPPWIKPARCTSLAEDSGVYYRCQHDEHADDEHRHEDSIIRTWPTSEESGRITEVGAA